jgi:hypothetical protein
MTEYKERYSELEVGDEVLINGRHNDEIAKIDRITKRQIVVGNTKFWRPKNEYEEDAPSLRQVGGSSWSRSSLSLIKIGDVERIEKAKKKADRERQERAAKKAARREGRITEKLMVILNKAEADHRMVVWGQAYELVSEIERNEDLINSNIDWVRRWLKDVEGETERERTHTTPPPQGIMDLVAHNERRVALLERAHAFIETLEGDDDES